MITFIVWEMLYLILAFILQVMIHEMGHLIFGKLTGYRFLSLRIFNVVIIKNQYKYSIKTYSYPGSAGQCLMLPPDIEKYPYIMITLGGVILNAVTAIIALIISFCLIDIPLMHLMGLYVFSFYGFGFALLNAIPMKEFEIVNDGTILIDMMRDPFARSCNKIQLLLIPELMAGKSYGEIPYKKFHIPGCADLSNSLIAYHKILKCYHYMDLRNWVNARICLNDFYLFSNDIPKMIRNIINMEQLFISVMQKDTTIKESEIYQNIKGYLNQENCDCNILRVRAAYNIFMSKQDKPSNRFTCYELKIKKLTDIIDKLKKNYIYLGDMKFCQSLLEEIYRN